MSAAYKQKEAEAKAENAKKLGHANYKINKDALEHTKFWVPHPTEGYVLAKVHKEDKGLLVPEDPALSKTFPLHMGQLANPQEMDGMPDNTNLMHLNEATMLANIRARYAKNLIYTYTGYILIAVNPYKWLPIYTTEIMESYAGKSIGVLPPHVFAVADRAYRMMKSEKTDQATLISGESGAGKTETAKKVMQFLVTIGGRKDDTGIEDRIIATNPLLEAFGNAKTPRNNNSSRFGKFMKIDFNNKAQVTGSTIEVYLLEKSRLIMQEKGNRCYHIFYMVCLGTTPEEKQKLYLDAPSKFAGISKGGDYKIANFDDVHEFQAVRKAMGNIGMSAAEQQEVFAIVAGLLHLGNIKFTTKSTKDSNAAIVKDESLSHTSEILALNEERFASVLVNRTIKSPRGSSMTIPLDVQSSEYGRDAMIKGVYNSLFLWMVDRINISLREKVTEQTFTSIGVLDIFGFEFFDHNSFEQLCINFCNEKLQQQFNQCIFKQELEIYAREAIRAPTVNFIDNQDVIDLFETPTTGLIALLDEQCRLPKGTDKGFAQSLHMRYSSHKRVAPPVQGKAALMAGGARAQLKSDEGFVIRHYAADVCYNVSGFLDKNNDTMHDDLQHVLQQSNNKLLQKVMADDKSVQVTKGGNKFKSVSGQFSRQLKSLIGTLNTMTCHFIRCIKPNDQQKPEIIQNLNVMDQLRCNGMFDALTLMHEGYPTRCPYAELYDRFAPLLPKEMSKYKPSYFCEALIMALDCDRADFQLGLTKLFFRSGKMAFLDDLKHQGDRGKIDPEIIAKVNKYLRRKFFRRLMFSVLSNIRFNTRIEKLRNFKRLRDSAAIVSMMSSNWLRAARKVRAQRAAAKIQALAVMYQERRLLRRKYRAVFTIQRWVRGFLVRKRYGAEVKKRGEQAKKDLNTPAGRERMAAIMKMIRAEDEERKRMAEASAAERRRMEEEKRAAQEAAELARRQAQVAEEKARRKAELMEYLGPLVEEKGEEIRQQYESTLEKEKQRVKELEEQLNEKSSLSKDQVEKLEAQVEELTQEINKTKKDYQNELQALKYQIEDSNVEKGRFKKQSEAFERDNADMRQRLSSLSDQLSQQAAESARRAEEAEQQRKAATLSASKQGQELSVVTAKLDEALAGNNKLNADLTTLQQNFEKETKARSKEKQEAQKMRQEFEERLQGAMSQSDESQIAASRALSKAREDLSARTLEKDNLESDNEILKRQVADLNAKTNKLADAQAQMQKDFDTQLAEVSARANQMEVDRSVVQVKYDALLAEIERLRAEVERLRREKEALEAEKSDMQATIEDLEAQLARAGLGKNATPGRVPIHIQQQLDDKDDEIAKVAAQNKMMEKKLNDVKSQLTNAQTELNTLEEKTKKSGNTAAQAASMLLQKEAEWSALKSVYEAKVHALEDELKTRPLAGTEDQTVKIDRLTMELEKAKELRKNNIVELNNLRAQIDDAQNQVSAVRREKAMMSKENVELKMQVEQLTADVEELEVQLEDANESNKHDARMRGMGQGQDLATELAVSQAKLTEALERSARLEDEMRLATTKAAEDAAAAAKARTELVGARGSLESKVDELQTELDDNNLAHTRVLAKMKEEIANLSMELENAQHENRMLNDKLANPTTARTSRRTDDARRALEDKVEQLSASEAKLSSDKTVLESKNQSLQAELDRLKDSLSRSQAEREPILAENVSLSSKVEMLGQKAEKAERANEKLRQRIQLLESTPTAGAGVGADAIKQKMDQLRQELEEARKKAGDDRQRMLDEMEEKNEQMTALNKKLRAYQQDAEETTNLRTQLERLSAEHNAALDLLRGSLARETESNQLNQARLNAKIATLEEQIRKGVADEDLADRLELLEIENKRLKDERLGRQDELHMLRIQADDASRDAANLKREKQDAASEAQAVRAKLAALQGDLDAAEDRYIKMQQRLNEGARSGAEVIQLQARLDESLAAQRLAAEEARAAKAKVDLEVKAHERSRSDWNRREQTLESKIEDMEAELDTKQRQMLAGLGASSSVKEEVSILRRDKEAAIRDRNLLQQRVDALEQDLLAATRQSGDSRKRLEEEVTVASARAHQAQLDKSVLELKLDSLRQEVDRAKKDAERFGKEKDPLQAENRRLKADVELAQLKLEKTMKTLERLRQKLRHGINPAVDAEAGTSNIRIKLDELQDIIQESFASEGKE